MVTVRAPATSANLGSGFDVFGVALGGPADIIRARRADRTTISVTGLGSEYIPEDPAENTAGVVAEALETPARIEIDKGVRPASGLGSSAASAAGAAVALNELYDRERSREELVSVAAEGERAVSGVAHADNVAPALLGGFTAATEAGVAEVSAEIPLVVCLPEVVVSTRDARSVLPERVERSQLVETVGRAATLVAGMCRDDPDLVGRGMADSVVAAARSGLVPGYDRAREAALAAGATGATMSGAGPAIVAACREGRRRRVAAATVEAFEENGVAARAYQTSVGDGARLY